MNQDQREVLAETLIRESLGLVVMGAVLWYLGPGRIWLEALAARVRAQWAARRSVNETEVARFRADVSRWEHEQAEKADRGPGGRPCGCDGQLPPARHRGHPDADADGPRVLRPRRRRGPADGPADHRERGPGPGDRPRPVRPGHHQRQALKIIKQQIRAMIHVKHRP